MAKLIMVCVRDEKADCYAHPFFVPAIGLALRMFEDWGKDPKTAVGQHPEDYRLYRVGLFDQASGTVEPERVPVFLQNAFNDEPVQRSIPQEHFSEVHGGRDGKA